MSLRVQLARFSLASALVAPGLLSGCGNEANTPEAQVAEKAAGIQPDSGTEKSVQSTKSMHVEKDTKVIDDTTGQILSETKESTPVKVTKQTKEMTDVKVDVGDTKTTGTPKK